MYFTSNDGSQNTFVYQATFDMLKLKKYKGTDYIPSWKAKGVCITKLKPLYTALWHIKISGYRMGISFE